MPNATPRPESQSSSIVLLRSSTSATESHLSSEHSTIGTVDPPSSRGPAILPVPVSPTQAFAPAMDVSAPRPPSVVSSISTTSTIAATEDAKDHTVDYEKPRVPSTPPRTSTGPRDLESGAEHPSNRRLAVLSGVALLVITVIVVAVVLSLHPSHHGPEHPPAHDFRGPPGQNNPRISAI